MSQNPMESLAASVETLSENCCLCVEDCEERIRQQPWTSVAIALAVGFILRFLPVGKILGLLFRTLLVLVKPALLVLGVLKIVSCFSERGSAPK